MNDHDNLKYYYDGVKEGIRRYAWMRDGVYYVGTTGRTMREALAQVEEEHARDVEALGKKCEK